MSRNEHHHKKWDLREPWNANQSACILGLICSCSPYLEGYNLSTFQSAVVRTWTRSLVLSGSCSKLISGPRPLSYVSRVPGIPKVSSYVGVGPVWEFGSCAFSGRWSLASNQSMFRCSLAHKAETCSVIKMCKTWRSVALANF